MAPASWCSSPARRAGRAPCLAPACTNATNQLAERSWQLSQLTQARAGCNLHGEPWGTVDGGRCPAMGEASSRFCGCGRAARARLTSFRLFEAEIKACGFHAYIMAGLPSPGTSLPDLTVANGWPPEWFEIYTRENFSAMDPVPHYGASTVQPFEWSEARYDKESNPAAHLVMTRATEFRLREGYCIPLHYDEGGAVISMATEQLNIDPVAKSALQLIGVYAHNRIRSLGRPATGKARRADGARTGSSAMGRRTARPRGRSRSFSRSPSVP